ncbi:uncharacterized protein LOC128967782 [Indicator indicator]|uniref:uncharacterized protein LOC128967782 n=1 Tax=Indicator indicator TaxID=1002788 RepID=UPI0023E01B47|nr:uncharacterized protein LOC128967782 [Indicator indicator]
MAETVDTIPRDEEVIQNNSGNEDPFSNHDAVMTSPGCSASSSFIILNEDKGNSAMPERLSSLSSKALAQAEVLTGPEMVNGGQVQRITSGLAEYHQTSVNASVSASSYLAAVSNLQPLDITLPCSTSLSYDLDQSLEVLQVPRAPGDTLQDATPLPGMDLGACHMQEAGSGAEDNMAPCSLGQLTWMKTTKIMETLENRKKEEKEKYRLQLAMYRRLLLLRSIRSLHKQLEQQQARLQECYGMVINTKKEVLKHICSTSPSPSP